MADFTVNPADVLVVSDDPSLNLDVSGGTLGTVYQSVEISLDWENVFDAFSSEAGFGLNGALDLAGTVHVPGVFGQFEGDAGTSDPTTLTFAGNLDNTYTGGDDLFFFIDQSWAGSSANWSNIALTFSEDVFVDPFSVSDTVTFANPAASVTLFDLVIDANGTDVIIDTLDTTAFGNNDTELFLIGPDGVTQLAANDDSGSLLSAITTTLDAGTYTVAVGGFDTTYVDGTGPSGFASDDADAGDIVLKVSTLSGSGATLNFDQVVPEPGSLALLGLGGLALLRRRR